MAKNDRKFNLKLVLEEVVEGDVGIAYMRIFKQSELCDSHNLIDTLNTHSEGLKRFINDKLTENLKRK